MTTEVKKRFPLSIFISFMAFGLFMTISFLLSDDISKYVLSGFSFSVKVILPTVFPFMIFSDLASHCFSFEKSSFFSNIFMKLFKINPIGISSFMSGISGGFPIGAKNSLKLYNNGKISKCECERLMSFSNLPSPAYVITALGIGITGSFRNGVTLYLCVLTSSIITGYFIGINKTFSQKNDFINEQKYSFISSSKEAISASTNTVFFVSFFSGVCGVLASLPIGNGIKAILISITEIGDGSLYISEYCNIDSFFSFVLISFSLSFSGLCVLSQTLALAKENNVSLKNLLFYKLIQGSISALLASIIYIVF